MKRAAPCDKRASIIAMCLSDTIWVPKYVTLHIPKDRLNREYILLRGAVVFLE